MLKQMMGAALLVALSVGGTAQAQQQMSAADYVIAVEAYVTQGNELTPQDVRNVEEIIATGEGVSRELFVDLGNALYANDYRGLGDKVMQSSVVMPERYVGAELRTEFKPGDETANDEDFVVERNGADDRQGDSE